MNFRAISGLLILLFNLYLCSAQRIEGRYSRPPSQDRPCTSTGKCADDKPISDPYENKDDKEVDTFSDWNSGDGSNYRPKPGASSGAYGSSRYGERPKVPEIEPPKPVDDDYSVERRPKPPPREDYRPKPPARDDYRPKPPPRDDYRPKPPPRDDYRPKPPPRDDYRPKPPTTDEYVPKPVVRDDYQPKPEVKPPHRDDYPTRPAQKDDYIPDRKPGGGPYGQGNRPTGGGGGNRDHGRPSYPSSDKDSKVDGDDLRDVKDDDYSDYRPGIPKPDTESKPAAVKDSRNCICVPYYQCKDGHIVTDGSGIIDARRRAQPDEDRPSDSSSCGPFHVCCDTPESSTVKPYEHRCGVRNPFGINSRILSPSNQGEADFGEWPWQAAVLKTEGTVNIFQCGGVLIDKYHIITVAHCVFHLYKYDDYPLKVRLGEWDTQTTSEFLAHEDYKVSKIIIHPEFRNTSLWNDIAILRLEEPVLYAPHIDTVCLPKYDESFAGQNCVVTGWGKDSYKGGTFSNVMKEIALQVIDNYGCEEMLRKTRLGSFFQLHEGFICAGGEYGLDSCKGDGGGPLVCYRKDKSYALAGLVSWGIDCGQPEVPGVYVKVQKYLDFISKNTGVSLEEYWPKT